MASPLANELSTSKHLARADDKENYCRNNRDASQRKSCIVRLPRQNLRAAQRSSFSSSATTQTLFALSSPRPSQSPTRLFLLARVTIKITWSRGAFRTDFNFVQVAVELFGDSWWPLQYAAITFLLPAIAEEDSSWLWKTLLLLARILSYTLCNIPHPRTSRI